MTITQFAEIWNSVCYGADAPVLIQLSKADFGDLAILLAREHRWLYSDLYDEEVFRHILRQGWMLVFGSLVVKDTHLFHKVGMVRLWTNNCRLHEVEIVGGRVAPYDERWDDSD